MRRLDFSRSIAGGIAFPFDPLTFATRSAPLDRLRGLASYEQSSEINRAQFARAFALGNKAVGVSVAIVYIPVTLNKENFKPIFSVPKEKSSRLVIYLNS